MSIDKALEHAANIKALCNWHNGTSIQKFDDIAKEIDLLEKALQEILDGNGLMPEKLCTGAS